jgi:hypothetical protein
MTRSRRVAQIALSVLALVLAGGQASPALAQSRFEQTGSRSQYVHWIPLRDATDREIDPTAANPPPYSPIKTCGHCHDVKAIAHGWHFNAPDPVDANGKAINEGRPGEPWLWVHPWTGTSIPLSYRGWPGTVQPTAVGLSPMDYILTFGRQLPGGLPRESQVAEPADPKPADATKPADAADAQPAQPTPASAPAKAAAGTSGGDAFRLSGQLEIDCLICHSADRSYSPERWAEQIALKNFAWAPTAAAGLATVQGSVKSLPADFDPAKAAASTSGGDTSGGGPQLPRTAYRADRFDAQKHVFIDVVRKPTNNACYYCHTTRPAGHLVPSAKGPGEQEDVPAWQRDEDVHVKAGLACVDCHRNAIGHNTVRGYEHEQHPTGQPVATLSCRGCHMPPELGGGDPEHEPGRMGAPRPLHKGIPPLHFDKMSCTSCHSGPAPTDNAQRWQTAMAHELGLPTHERTAESMPPIVEPVIMKDEAGVYWPYRMTWPSYWGKLEGEHITPLAPEEIAGTLRVALRVRKDFSDSLLTQRLRPADLEAILGKDRADAKPAEWTEAEKAKVAQHSLVIAINALKKKFGDARYVYVTGGKAYKLKGDNEVEAFDHADAKPYAWKLAHDVRPARWALGVKGCKECHADGTPFFDGKVTAIGTLPDAEPITVSMKQLQGVDPNKLDLGSWWNRSFQGRDAFKWVAFVCVGAVALLLLLYVLVGLNGLLRIIGIGRR